MKISLKKNEALIFFEYLNKIADNKGISEVERIIINNIICDMERKIEDSFMENYKETLRNAEKEILRHIL